MIIISYIESNKTWIAKCYESNIEVKDKKNPQEALESLTHQINIKNEE